MKIRMRIDISGTRHGEWEPGVFATREWPRRGSVLELPDAEAAEYCDKGMADPVAVFAQAETAVPKVPVEERAEPTPGLRTDTESGAAVRRGPGRPRNNPVPTGRNN